MFAPWKKSYDWPRQNVKKQSHYFANNFRLVKAMVFPIVMYGCESWTIKKADSQKNDAFDLWLEKTLESHLDYKEIQSVNPKGHQPWILIGRLMLKLKLQYFGHLMRRTDSLEKTLMPGKIEGRRRRDNRGWDGWMASPIQWTWVWAGTENWWWTGKPVVLQSTGSQRVRHDWLNWTEVCYNLGREMCFKKKKKKYA